MRKTVRFLSASYAITAVLLILAELVLADDPRTLEGAILTVVFIGIVLGFALAWRHELVGGGIAFLFGWMLIAFILITAGRNQLVVAPVIGGPVVALGSAFMWLGRKHTTE